MSRLKQLWILAAVCLLPVTAAFAVDRLLLAPVCPDCHAEITKTLPLFDGTQDGLVRIRANSMEFRARVAGFGNRGGEGVILLHGFPETSIMWEPLLERLSKEGLRAVAFDQRGYSPGARPFSQNASPRASWPRMCWRSRTQRASSASMSSATISAEPSPGSWQTAIRNAS